MPPSAGDGLPIHWVEVDLLVALPFRCPCNGAARRPISYTGNHTVGQNIESTMENPPKSPEDTEAESIVESEVLESREEPSSGQSVDRMAEFDNEARPIIPSGTSLDERMTMAEYYLCYAVSTPGTAFLASVLGVVE